MMKWLSRLLLSASGLALFDEKAWRMPDDWKGVRKVEVHRLTPEGCVLAETGAPVTGANLVLTLAKQEGLSVVPAGTRISGRTVK